MPKSSIFGTYLPAPITAFDEGEPVASWRATELQQNILHLTDEFTQTYINWIAPEDDGIYDPTPPGGADPDYVVWSQEYPHRWLGPNKPSNLDLHVWGGGMVAGCRIVPYTTPVAIGLNEFLSAPAVFIVGLTLGAYPDSASYTHQNTQEDVGMYDRAWYRPATVAAPGFDGVFEPQICRMRLDIMCISESPLRLNGVCLRGFA